jgi:hypothetical protein
MFLSTNLNEGDLCDWLYSQPGYDQSVGSLSVIDLLSKLEATNAGPDYYFQGVVAPKQYLQSGVPGLTTVSDEFSLPEGTIIWGIGAYATDLVPLPPSLPMLAKPRAKKGMNLQIPAPPGPPVSYGMRLQIYERGSQQYLYGRTYAKDGVSTGQNTNSLVVPNGIKFFRNPIFVLPPGQIQIMMTNLSQNLAILQVFLACAVPLAAGVTGVYSQKGQ